MVQRNGKRGRENERRVRNAYQKKRLVCSAFIVAWSEEGNVRNKEIKEKDTHMEGVKN